VLDACGPNCPQFELIMRGLLPIKWVKNDEDDRHRLAFSESFSSPRTALFIEIKL
jgi:hypothetical protein